MTENKQRKLEVLKNQQIQNANYYKSKYAVHGAWTENIENMTFFYYLKDARKFKKLISEENKNYVICKITHKVFKNADGSKSTQAKSFKNLTNQGDKKMEKITNAKLKNLKLTYNSYLDNHGGTVSDWDEFGAMTFDAFVNCVNSECAGEDTLEFTDKSGNFFDLDIS